MPEFILNLYQHRINGMKFPLRIPGDRDMQIFRVDNRTTGPDPVNLPANVLFFRHQFFIRFLPKYQPVVISVVRDPVFNSSRIGREQAKVWNGQKDHNSRGSLLCGRPPSRLICYISHGDRGIRHLDHLVPPLCAQLYFQTDLVWDLEPDLPDRLARRTARHHEEVQIRIYNLDHPLGTLRYDT